MAKKNSVSTQVTSKIHEFLPALNDILRSGTSEENWERFQQLIREITDKVRTVVKIPVYNNNSNNNTRPKPNPEDPKRIQKLYKRNRRKAIRIILGEEGRRCEIDKRRSGERLYQDSSTRTM
jgi:hypothetical protein